MSTFYMKRNDLLPVFTATLNDASGAINLTGATVRLHLKNVETGTVKVNAAGTVVTPLTGSVSYTWAGTDTDTAGVYEAEWEITVGGKTLSVPNNTQDKVIITEDLI